jgi:DNA-binding beta-propeller fold protein YncE
VKARVPANEDADGVAMDRGTGHVFVIEGDSKKITVVDPRTDTALADIDVGEAMEFPVASDGKVLVAGVQNGDLIEVDPLTNAGSARAMMFDPVGR